MNTNKVKKPVTKGWVKVPQIMQMETLECGAACLSMVLAYYHKYLPLEQVRADCGVSRDGSNAKNIYKAATNYGLDTRAYRYEPDELKKNGSFPCIIHWTFNHFVVLCGFKKDRAVINDPARGCFTASPEEFDNSFTGICLEFTPSSSFEPSGKPADIMSFFHKRLSNAKLAVLLVSLTTIAVSILNVINLSFSKVFVDILLNSNNDKWLVPFIVVVAVVGLLYIGALGIKEISSFMVNGRLAAIGSTSFMWQIMRMPMEFFSQRTAGDIQIRRISNTQIAGIFVNTLAPLAFETVMMLLYLAIMLKYSVWLTLIGVLSIIINVFICSYISRKRINITRVMLRDEGKLASTTVSGIELIDSIKASGSENGFFEKWAGYQASVNAGQVKYNNISLKLGILPALTLSLTEIAVLSLGVFLVINGSFTAGMLLAFQGFLTAFTSPARKIISAGQTLQELRSDVERVDDVMQYPADSIFCDKSSDETQYDKLKGNIEIKDVTFGYSRLSEPVIRNFNLTVKPGSRIAIVGASGCGKSTVSKLLSGLYKPWSGEILFDGKPINKIDRAVFTGSLAVVDQDVILFEDTIANNIKMWDRSIEDFEMIMAARDACIHDDIIQRNGGYNYVIAEGGKDFSGGQKQRLEIARVLAQDPTVIIMDEATSALDAKTENEVVNSITDRGITCIVIAHRLSTIRNCDEIIVVDKGEIAERGTHQELYNKGGLYTNLISNE